MRDESAIREFYQKKEDGGMMEMPGYQQAPPQAPQYHDAHMYASPQAATGYAGVAKEEMAYTVEEEGKKRWQGMNPDKGEDHESGEAVSNAVQGQMYMGQAPVQQPMQQPMQGQMYMGHMVQPGYPVQQPPVMNRQVSPFYTAPMMPHSGSETTKGEHSCNCGGHNNEDAGIFGMIKQLVDKNPELSSLSAYANATNSDFIKGLLIGAGVALFFSNSTVQDSIAGLFSGIFGGKEIGKAEAAAPVAEAMMAEAAGASAVKQAEEIK